MKTKYYINSEGKYLGGRSEDIEAPDGGIEVPSAPDHADCVWNGSGWGPSSMGRKSEILDELAAIDIKTIRPLRAGETEKLANLETQAQALRDELKAL